MTETTPLSAKPEKFRPLLNAQGLTTRVLKGELQSGILGGVVTSESSRHDLYTGLVELLGLERAKTLMAYLPAYDPAQLATKEDLRTEIGRVETEMRDGFAALSRRIDEFGQRMDDLSQRMEGRLDELNRRMDRLFQTVVAGLFVIVAAMASVMLTAIL